MEIKYNIDLINNFIYENKLSKTKFCKLCKISSQTLNKIFNNKYEGNLMSLFRIARVMKINLHQLFV